MCATSTMRSETLEVPGASPHYEVRGSGDVLLMMPGGPAARSMLTSSEVLQWHLPAVHVPKVFNNFYFEHLAPLAHPISAVDRSALPIACDGPAAKTAFVESFEESKLREGGRPQVRGEIQ